MLFLVVLTVVTVLMAIALDEWISYILAAAVELLRFFLFPMEGVREKSR